MAEPPPRPPDDDETVVVPPDETAVGDEWAVPPERRVAFEERREEAVPPQRRFPTLWPWLLALLVLVLAGLGVAWYLTRDDDDEPAPTTAAGQVEVPLLVGLTEERARERLRDAELEAEVTRRESEEPEGVVVEQDPERGTRVDEGETVRLVVSEGRGETTTGETTTTAAPETARVPEVVGQSSSDATATLRDAGFDVAIVPVPSDEPEGTVVAQSPSAGAEAEEGSEVRLNVAQAAEPEPEPATVPDAVGQAAADAAQAFGAEGLRVALRYVPSDEQAGTVVAQAREPGTELEQGDTVQVNVSTGAEPAESARVPDVGGQPLDEARETLSGAGFEVLALNLSDELRRTDTVAAQTPAGGASIPGGSLVVLYVTR